MYISCLLFGWLLFSNAELPAPSSKVHIIRVEGMDFVPSSIEISKGDIVRWVNTGSCAHNIVAKDGSFESEMLIIGAQYEHTFNRVGSFSYFCRPHRLMGMKGVVVVK